MSGAQTQPARPGMRRIPIPFESYQSPSPPLSYKRLLNLYTEEEPSDARSTAVLISTAGLWPTGFTLGSGPVTAMSDTRYGYVYAVSGSHFWRVTAPGGVFTPQDLGEIGVPDIAGMNEHPHNIMPTIAIGVDNVVVCIPPRAYTCDHAAASVNEIGGSFPGARSVTYLDGYFVFTDNAFNSRFFCTKLFDPTDFDALDFAYADAVPNVVRRVV